MKYQVEVLAQAICAVWNSDSKPDKLDYADAELINDFLERTGWMLVRTIDEEAGDGPIQRALGIEHSVGKSVETLGQPTKDPGPIPPEVD